MPALLARLGFEVHSVRGIAQAALALGGSQAVALVVVSADPPAGEASDLLPLLSEFGAASGARLVLATRAPNSVFAAALANKGVKVLAHPFPLRELRAVAVLARDERAFETKPPFVRARAARLRRDSAELSSAALLLVERARTLVAHAHATCRTYAGGPEAPRAPDRR